MCFPSIVMTDLKYSKLTTPAIQNFTRKAELLNQDNFIWNTCSHNLRDTHILIISNYEAIQSSSFNSRKVSGAYVVNFFYRVSTQKQDSQSNSIMLDCTLSTKSSDQLMTGFDGQMYEVNHTSIYSSIR